MNLYEAQWLAYALPYRRFAAALTDCDARLGADMDRYSFIVSDLHRLLVAGLPAHCERFCTSSAQNRPQPDDGAGRPSRVRNMRSVEFDLPLVEEPVRSMSQAGDQGFTRVGIYSARAAVWVAAIEWACCLWGTQKG
jgi:hypothetical protein